MMGAASKTAKLTVCAVGLLQATNCGCRILREVPGFESNSRQSPYACMYQWLSPGVRLKPRNNSRVDCLEPGASLKEIFGELVRGWKVLLDHSHGLHHLWLEPIRLPLKAQCGIRQDKGFWSNCCMSSPALMRVNHARPQSQSFGFLSQPSGSLMMFL